jgi:predicted acyl esterase
MTTRGGRIAAALVVATVLAAAPASVGPERSRVASATAPTLRGAADAGTVAGGGRSSDTLDAHGSVEEVYVLGAPPGATAQLLDRSGETVKTKEVDSAGTVLFERVATGAGYTVVTTGDGEQARSDKLRVLDPRDHPPASFYERQTLQPGLNYIETRDGTSLAAMVRLPGPVEEGPYPTVIEYSGYDPANPDSAEPSTLLAGVLGYATVGVNVRGTGCSGGAFDIFEPLQSLDGYDAVETVAAQPWVEFGEVGMVGISYPGIMQLFVAGTRPPHLAAISPLSVIDDIYRATLYPGGILNTGFATTWAQERQQQAEPGGQEWAQDRIDNGDATCRDNQALRGQNHDLSADIEANRYYTPGARAEALTPYEFVDRINVPVFLAGAWQDEQTGGHFPNMLDRFRSAPLVRFTLTNGTHADSLGPAIITRLAEFLDLYVARRTPEIPDGIRGLAPVLYAALMGVGGVELPPDRFRGLDYEEARRRFEAEPPVRVLFESGAGTTPGSPVPRFEATFARWPPPATDATAWFFGPDGRLTDHKPTARDGADRYQSDPASRPETSLPGDSVEAAWTALPPYTWEPLAEGTAVAYESEPLAQNTAMVGPGSLDLWLQSNAPDTDVQVTLTEVRPDAKETYVQSGWLRASHRALDTDDSTALRPRHTHRRSDAEPLPRGEFAKVRVELFPFGHVFREGSRIRVSVSAPGGDRPRWRFRTLTSDDPVTNTIARSAAHPSRIVLPVVDGIEVPAGAPPCPGLRGQPCRDYVAADG